MLTLHFDGVSFGTFHGTIGKFHGPRRVCIEMKAFGVPFVGREMVGWGGGGGGGGGDGRSGGG